MHDKNYLAHYGVKGMKWGVRRKSGYRSTGIRSALAKRSNDKVDASFKNWGENAKKRDDAIALGKKANTAKIAYEKDKTNKDLKADYKQANKDYKKALKENTTYRKGVVRKEVGKDASRKYLSEAKKVKKQLDNDPYNKQLQKQYDSLMSKHDVERANARRAVDVSTKRMRKEASLKRSMTMGVKSVATSAALAVGTIAVNKYLNDHQVTINGKEAFLSAQHVSDVVDYVKDIRRIMDYLY